MTETPREIRENLIMQWNDKRHNGEELLKILQGCEGIDDSIKKNLKQEMMKNFYNNYEKAKENPEYQQADALYLDIKKTNNSLKRKSAELAQKESKTENDLDQSEQGMLKIAETAMELEDGAWWKRGKLRRANDQRDELASKRNKIKREIGALEMEKMEIESALKNKEMQYGDKITRHSNWKAVNKYDGIEAAETKNDGLKGYKKRYMQMVKDKEKYMSDLISEMSDMDFGVDEEIKNKILENVKGNMAEEIKAMKGGDELTKLADEKEKWLKENWDIMMETLYTLDKTIKDKENEIRAKESEGKGTDADEILQLKEEEFALRTELLALQKESEAIKCDLNEKFNSYYGSNVNWGKEFLKIENKKRGNNGKQTVNELEVAKKARKQEGGPDKRSEFTQKIPEGLKNYRSEWKRKIKFISEENKEKIINAADKIKVDVMTDKNGDTIIKFKLGDKVYKILDPKIENHTDGYYSYFWAYDSITGKNKNNVNLGGMRGNDIDARENKKLQKYVKKKYEEGRHIPHRGEMSNLLSELGNQALLLTTKGKVAIDDSIAMLMYLTGIDGYYRLACEKLIGRNRLDCVDANHEFYRQDADYSFGRIMMISYGSDDTEDPLGEKDQSKIEKKDTPNQENIKLSNMYSKIDGAKKIKPNRMQIIPNRIEKISAKPIIMRAKK